MDGQRPLQLQDLAERLVGREASDPKIVLQALSLAPVLIKAAPDELTNCSGSFAQTSCTYQP